MKHIATVPPAYRSHRRERRSLAAYGFPYPPTARTITRQGTTRNDAFTYNDRSESPRRLVGGLDKPRSAFAPRGRAGNGVPASQLISDVVDGTGLNGWDYDRAGAASSSGVASHPVLFTKDDNSVSVACTYDYMGRRATKSEDVYLWSYGDGGPDFTYGFKREPIIYK